MSHLLVVDVFESYYEGRKAPFPAEDEEVAQRKLDEQRPPAKDAKPGPPVKQAA